jgi:hypothetical protein
MSKSLDVAVLLRRGGEMTPSEVGQLGHELTQSKLLEMATGVSERTLDRPVIVVASSGREPTTASGYFTQQKYIWGKTPEQMESILVIFGKLSTGAFVLQFEAPLGPRDYESKGASPIEVLRGARH